MVQPAEPPVLVVTIQPLYLLAAEIAGDEVRVQRLVPPHRSPHDYRLLPSQRLQLAGADAIAWMGPQLETGLATLLQEPGLGVPVHALSQVQQLPEEGHAAHDADAHDWLDPLAAAELAYRLATILTGLDPAHELLYQQRAGHIATALEASYRMWLPRLEAMRSRHYWVAHDAYGQFEARFGLQHSAMIAISPDRPPGAGHVLALQRQLAADRVDCVFGEPQFRPPVLERLLVNRSVRLIELDPLASTYAAAPGAFQAFWEDFAARFEQCAEH